MNIGNRIKQFRLRKNLTQKELGILVGFPEKNADARIAQYEAEKRIPKKELTNKLAYALDVSPYALDIPNVQTAFGAMQMLFYLEDLYGIEPKKRGGTIVLTFDPLKSRRLDTQDLKLWCEMLDELKKDEITQEEYDHWRYNYPPAPA